MHPSVTSPNQESFEEQKLKTDSMKKERRYGQEYDDEASLEVTHNQETPYLLHEAS